MVPSQTDRTLPALAGRAVDMARPRTLFAALVVLALALALGWTRMQPPRAAGVDAPLDAFSAGRAIEILHGLLAEEEPHPVGSAQNARVRERIVALLGGLGYDVTVQEATSCADEDGEQVCAPVQNILARVPGREVGPALALMAHYDSVPAGPGVADDGSSVATILELARIVKQEGPYRAPILFLLTDGEEAGLLGARAFLREHPWASDVGVVINLEARGSSGQSLMFETSPGNAWLIDAYASSVPLPASNSLMYEIYRIMPNDTDLTPFKEAGIAGLNFAFIEDGAYYHSAEDNFAHLDPSSVQHHGETALALMRRLAVMDLSTRSAGNAIYMDVLGLGVVRWPESWTLPLNGAAALLLVFAAWRLVRGGRMTLGGLGLGVLAAFLTILGSILIGLGLTWLIATLAGTPQPWTGTPLPTRIALWAGSLLCGLLLGAAFGRRAGLWGLGLGTWLLWLILSLVLGLTLVGAAVVLLVPAMAAVVLLAVVGGSSLARFPLAREGGLLVSALFAGAIWFQLALRFEAAVGFELSPAVTLSMGLVATTVLPAYALSRGQTRARTWMSIAAGAVVVGAVAAAVVFR
ncbi:MAG: M20/M25/M40 family metallo-hydrolase [Anaerolineae bacterium]